MKPIFFLFLFSLSIFNFAFAQNPLVKIWDGTFGGTDSDDLQCMKQTSDGGYILGGTSSSGIGGNKSQPSRGGWDYWIVKTDSLGMLQWEHTFGGSGDDYFQSLAQTPDGGFILGGYSGSQISGDKTQMTRGGYDYWIIKTDSLGNKQWDKDFGGTNTERLYSVQQTDDNGFILSGHSSSGIGGDKTQSVWGVWDYWILKTDSVGNKLWDKDFGGTDYEELHSAQQTADGGFVFGGFSLSGTGGDKTQGNWGYDDYWIVKTDSLGNKQWDKDFGGTDEDYLYSIQQSPDGGYFLAGRSQSGISGDKTQAGWGFDYWIVKTDSLGNKQWDKVFGGLANDEFWNGARTKDGGFLFSGDSYSPVGGNKTENNLGFEQTWVVKTDSLGNSVWDKTIFTSGHDEQGSAIETSDGCYVMANISDGGMAGYKSQASWNNTHDYWIVKFCDTTQQPVSAFTSNSGICPGTCIDFMNLSYYATFYQWNFPGANPDTSTAINPTSICYATPGTYDVQLIATNANGSDTLLLTNYITVYPTPPPQAITQSGDTLFAIAGATSYQWYFNGSIISGATDYFYVASSSGDYNVVATDGNGCEVEAAVFNVVASIGAIEDHEILICPNPVEDRVKIQKLEVTRTAIEISIYNVIGEKMEIEIPSTILQNESAEINAQSLSPGLYYLELKTSEKTFRSKFVKQ